MAMDRYFIELSFKGTRYHGWQIQPNALSVQALIEKAIATLNGEYVKVTGAGRTDTGVHARFYIAHFDVSTLRPVSRDDWLYKMNALLPPDIAINDIYRVKSEAHARYSAVSRTYAYTISRIKDPFNDAYAWHYTANLNLKVMNEASRLLMNCTDFTSFSKLHGNSQTNLCKLYQSEWTTDNRQLIFTIKANRFLRNMVRSIVGTMVDLGRGKISFSDFTTLVEGRDRKLAGFSAPAQGLSLVDVKYPKDIRL